MSETNNKWNKNQNDGNSYKNSFKQADIQSQSEHAQDQLEYDKMSKLNAIKGTDESYFNFILEKYKVDKERFLQDLLREQKILLDKEKRTYNISNYINNLRRFYKKQDIIEVLEKSDQQRPFKDLNDYLNYLCRQTKEQINYFKPNNLADTLNGLAHLDIAKEDLSVTLGGDDKLKSDFLEPVCTRINNILSGKIRDRNSIVNFNPTGLANTLNGLVTIFLYSKDISKETEETVLSCINNILTKATQMDWSKTDPKSKHALKKNLFYLKNVLQLPVLNNEKLHPLNKILEENIHSSDSHIKSSLELKVDRYLKDNENNVIKKSIKEEESISYSANGIKYSHPVDFVFNYKGKTIFCEIDGPTHFSEPNQTEESKNPQTKIRDQISKYIISKINEKENKNDIYMTLPANVCEDKRLFFDHIDKILEQETAKEKQSPTAVQSVQSKQESYWGRKAPKKSVAFSEIIEKEKNKETPQINSRS